MSTLPEYRFSRFRFYTPTGFEAVRLEGENVVGRWNRTWGHFYGESGSTVAQRFVNWEWAPEQIIKFTNGYGPIRHSPYLRPLGFSFSLESWRQNQWQFRKVWAGVQKGRNIRTQLLEVGQAEIKNGWLDFGCGTLWDFMTFELLSQPEKLRYCRRSDCSHPYFVAQHGKEQYCSTDCANWAQNQWKKEWHETQRQKRLVKDKGGKRGTSQTR